MLPMSASAKLVSMRISVRSLAILISVGVWKLAATVREAEIDDAVDDDTVDRRTDHRETEIGPVARVLRLRLGQLRARRRAPAPRSYSCFETYSSASSAFIRSSLALAGRGVACVGHRCRALALAGRDQRIVELEQRLAGPDLVVEIDVEFLHTVPDTWVPTLISTTGLSVPLAETVCVTVPRPMSTVR